jgi:type II secretory pathway pseudopilin PulG
MRSRARAAFTLVELLVVVTIITLLVGLLLPAVQSARESARRLACVSHLKQIGLALHNYATQRGVLPPGAILAAYPQSAGTNNYDPFTEATSAAAGCHATSWMLHVLPFLEQQNLYDQWDFGKGALSNKTVAATDIETFFCPSRRSGTRPKDQRIMFPDWARGDARYTGWTRGGNDYAGCAGAQNVFTNPSVSDRKHRLFCGPEYVYDWRVTGTSLGPTGRTANNDPICLCGIFVPNRCTAFREISDGLTNTIMIGEVPRAQTPDLVRGHTDDAEYWGPCHTSVDGWAVAGSGTLFDTAKAQEGGDKGQKGGFNNDYFESAGSDHGGGAHFGTADAHFGTADGAVRFVNDRIDPIVYAYLGSIADGQLAQMPQD